VSDGADGADARDDDAVGHWPDAIIRAMSGSSEEVEVKLPFSSAAEALARLQRAGATARAPRTFEDNALWDRDLDPLADSGRMLRVRRAGRRSVLTFKRKVEGEHRHKVCEEHETEVADARALENVLRGVGFRPAYRYQKYRTELTLEGVDVSLDETPLGCFVELEGERDAIDRAAERLGFTPERYVRATYRELQLQTSPGHEPGDLLMRDEADDPARR
jgi:adenylate cyclase class 2